MNIEFFTHVPNRILAACAWLQSSWHTLPKIVVYAPNSETALSINKSLWTQPAIGFLPHCSIESTLAKQTPVLICGQPYALIPPNTNTTLVNLSDEIPPSYQNFAALFEFVSEEPCVVEPARIRFRSYRAAGYDCSNRVYQEI